MRITPTKARVPEASVPTKSARGMKRRSGKTRTWVLVSRPRSSAPRSTRESRAHAADPDQHVERETDEPVLRQDPLELAVDPEPHVLRRIRIRLADDRFVLVGADAEERMLVEHLSRNV